MLFTKYKQKLEFFLLFFLSCLIILYIFYIRVIYKRFPKSLVIVKIESDELLITNYAILAFVIISILVSIILITVSIKKLFFTHKKSLTTFLPEFLIKISLFCYLSVKKALFTVYEYICDHIKYLYNFFSKPIMRFYFFTVSHKHYIIFFEFFLRSIILSCFYLDVFIFFQFKYFYQSLFLLTWILLIQLWFFILKDFSSNLSFFEEKLSISYENEDTPEQVIRYNFAPEYENEGFDLVYHVEEYRNCLSIKEYLEEFESLKIYYIPRFNLLYYSFFLFGNVYILLSNLKIVIF